MKRRIKNLLIAVDQFLWVLITLGSGNPDETISAAAWRLERQGRTSGRVLRPLIDLLFLPLERDHCRHSAEAELLRLQLPAYYRPRSPP